MILFNPQLGEGQIREFNTFLKRICQKVNIITRMDFELTYFKTIIQHFSNYITGTSPNNLFEKVWEGLGEKGHIIFVGTGGYRFIFREVLLA